MTALKISHFIHICWYGRVDISLHIYALVVAYANGLNVTIFIFEKMFTM